MPSLKLKSNHKAITTYYAEINNLAQLRMFSEGAVSPAFATLLRACATQFHWTLSEQYPLTLAGIPPQVYDYKLGNRSALEWVIDQYQVSTDKRSGIVNDPNQPTDPQAIVRLIGQVITVSVETVEIVNNLPPLTIQPVRG